MTPEPHRQMPRRSGGGTAVEASLHAAGFDIHTPYTALVETARPRREPFLRVLAQNAWTVLPAEDYAHLAAPYPSKWRARMALRRAVAKMNMHRADEIVCLTESMGDMVRRSTRTPVTVARALTPTDVVATGTPTELHIQNDPAVVLVPGTITWYKRPQLALKVAKDIGRHLGSDPMVLFGGQDDRTGAWEATQEEARRTGLEIMRAALDRKAMMHALRSSVATVLPSELESLSLSLSEALLLSPRVVASSLPVHREVSEALGRRPEWLEPWTPHAVPASVRAHVAPVDVLVAWQRVGRALQLPERREEGLGT